MHEQSKSKILTSDEINHLVEKYGTTRESLLPILQRLVDNKNFITTDEVRQISYCLNINPTEIYSIASYYSFLSIKPLGQYVIWVCNSIVCEMHGNKEILEVIKSHLNINVNQTTKDNLFSLKTTPCLGLCYKAPAFMINEKVYTDLDGAKVIKILDEIKNEALLIVQDSLILELNNGIIGELGYE